jgi:regulator of protease activity HflC (stomatin/prohibitin superfamily)
MKTLIYDRIRIRQGERGLRFRGGDLVEVLRPGRHWVRGRVFGAERDSVVKYDLTATRVDIPRLDVLLSQPNGLREELEIVELGDTERAVIWKDGRVGWVLGPGRYAFWKEPSQLRVERFDASTVRLESENVDAILVAAARVGLVSEVDVREGQELLVFRDGELVERLTTGRYVYWTGVGRILFKSVDRREQVLDVAGQEIMTNDKVTLRVNLVVTYRVTDPVAAVTVVSDPSQALYREAQLALRAAVGTRPIDALLSDKESVGSEVAKALSTRAAEFGVAVRGVGLRDIVLPGDMKEILNRVITAQKEAEANIIKRREETAAARSQANTARLLAQNPVLARMKELELLQDVLAGTNATFVLGPGDLSDQVRGLIAGKSAGDG